MHPALGCWWLSLIKAIENEADFEPYVFVTGMHMLETYGYTLIEVQKSGFKNITTFENHTDESTMDLTLAKLLLLALPYQVLDS